MRSVVVGPLGQWTIEASAYTTTGWPSPPGGWSIGKGSSLPGTPMMMGHQHFLGFSHQAGGAAVSFGSFIMERADQRWTAPAWFMLTLFSILPALSLLARLRRNHARHQNRCPTCGYDLRAHTPGQRCPECGSQITSVPHTAASPALAGAPHASDHS
ncbi:MAG TPA: hypothetical protein VHQ47_00695 [Phycisphaerae bacterium]|nr:hypothetical protein [Phycisphaerae bacterium]